MVSQFVKPDQSAHVIVGTFLISCTGLTKSVLAMRHRLFQAVLTL